MNLVKSGGRVDWESSGTIPAGDRNTCDDGLEYKYTEYHINRTEFLRHVVPYLSPKMPNCEHGAIILGP